MFVSPFFNISQKAAFRRSEPRSRTFSWSSTMKKRMRFWNMQGFDPGFPPRKNTAKHREFLIALSDNAVQVIHYTSRIILSRQEVIRPAFLHKIDKRPPFSSTNPTIHRKSSPPERYAIIPVHPPRPPRFSKNPPGSALLAGAPVFFSLFRGRRQIQTACEPQFVYDKAVPPLHLVFPVTVTERKDD